MKPLIAGNWKMNGDRAASDEIEALIKIFDGSMPEKVDVLICPPATLLMHFSQNFSDEGLQFGGQDCHGKQAGAHTGDLSADMLADAGAAYAIVGHSERRSDHQEDDAVVCVKAMAALAAGLNPIICVGETREERENGAAEAVVGAQLAGSIPAGATGYAVAYEPVWAIGTGLTPTRDDIAKMHAEIRKNVGPDVRILYGGSVKPDNAKEILAIENVGGALVGGASLKASDFAAIIQAATI
ncbi:MAG: triose-phosphate isomerase [Pseudomonadota bacterium]